MDAEWKKKITKRKLKVSNKELRKMKVKMTMRLGNQKRGRRERGMRRWKETEQRHGCGLRDKS